MPVSNHVTSALFWASSKASCQGYPNSMDTKLSVTIFMLTLGFILGAWIWGTPKVKVTPLLFTVAAIIAGMLGLSSTLVPFVMVAC